MTILCWLDVRENLFHCGLLEITVIDWLIGVSPKPCICLHVLFFLDVCIQVSLFHKDTSQTGSHGIYLVTSIKAPFPNTVTS